MPESAVTYVPLPDATPETEASTLANIYRFIIDCRTKKKEAAPESRPDDAKGPKHDRATRKYTRT